MGIPNLTQPAARSRSSVNRRAPGETSSSNTSALDAARNEISAIDSRLVALIADRARVAREIGQEKRSLGMTLLDPAREAAVVRRAGELARESGIDAEAIRTIFWQLIALSRNVQSDQP
jgi:chorismate mutase